MDKLSNFVQYCAMRGNPRNSDRRVARTKRLLRGAMVELITEKDYDSITVQDLIDRADVGRSTFYTHFRDKEDLFRGDWEQLLESFAATFSWDGLSEGRLVPIEHLFEHLKEFHPFYRGLVRSGKSESVFRYGQRYLAELLELDLKQFETASGSNPVPYSLLSSYISGEIFSVLKWWLDNNMPHSPEEMNEIFHTLVVPGVAAALEDRAPAKR